MRSANIAFSEFEAKLKAKGIHTERIDVDESKLLGAVDSQLQAALTEVSDSAVYHMLSVLYSNVLFVCIICCNHILSIVL